MSKEIETKRMSSGQPLVHLSPSNTQQQINKKIAQSFCQPGNLEGNVAIQLVRNVIFPLDDNNGNFEKSLVLIISPFFSSNNRTFGRKWWQFGSENAR